METVFKKLLKRHFMKLMETVFNCWQKKKNYKTYNWLRIN